MALGIRFIVGSNKHSKVGRAMDHLLGPTVSINDYDNLTKRLSEIDGVEYFCELKSIRSFFSYIQAEYIVVGDVHLRDISEVVKLNRCYVGLVKELEGDSMRIFNDLRNGDEIK